MSLQAETFSDMSLAEAEVEPGQVACLSMSIKSINDAAAKDDPGRFFSGMLNAHTVDRENEIFDPAGCDLSAYKAAGGPILAGSHFSEVLPGGHSAVVARALSVSRSDKGIFISKAEFDRDETSEHWKGKVHRGFVRCLSAGLLVKAVEYKKSVRDGQERTIRQVVKSELFHAILTCQPVNRESIIAAKSMARIRELEDRIKAMADAPDRLAGLLTEAQSLIDKLVEFQGKSQTVEPEPVSPELEQCSNVMAESLECAYLAAHPDLPDAAFVIEDGGKGRHLPHHTPGVKSSAENATVNKALLRNALARVSRAQPVTEDSARFRERAEKHLRAHALALGIK